MTKFIPLLFCISSHLLTCFGQEEVVLSDHKSLLGEIHYGNRVGGIQAQEGKSIEVIVFEESDVLNGIQVFLSEHKVVTGFQLEVEQEKGTKIFSFGNTSSIPQKRYCVPSNLRLVGISGASGWYIDSLAFTFDDGSSTPRYGGVGGDVNFRLELNKNLSGK